MSGRRQKFLAVAAAAAAIAVAAAGCSSSSGGSSSPSGQQAKAVKGGTATVGVISGAAPTWTWPFTPVSQSSVVNKQDFQWLLYRPLYMFGGNNNSVNVNYPLSTGNPPVYTDGGKTVTIHMKGWKWSNGETVNAADVAFYLNMLKAEKKNYVGYSPGGLPDDLASFDVTSASTIVLHLTKAYASTWFTYNELALITPFPLAWDVTRAGAKAGSGGCSTSAAKCPAVYKFLTAQAKDPTSYGSSPIWGVVDGPWKLTAFSDSGNDTFVPNPSYSGEPKPSISKLQYVPYTSDTAEYTALKTGTLDVAAIGVGIPSADLPPKPAGSALPASNPLGSGFYLEPFYSYAIAFAEYNFQNPKYGPVFKQLYFRQALAYLTDQEGMAKAVYRGYAYPTTGPVPPKPANQFAPPVESANGGAGAYPFSITKAKSLLTSHGWQLVGGVMTCEVQAKCGAGVAKGTQAKFTMDYTSGFGSMVNQMGVFKSDLSRAGIQITTVGQSFSTMLSTINNQNKSWQMGQISGWAYDGPGFLPTGEPLFQTGAGAGFGYSNPEMDSLIDRVQTDSSLSLFHQYATYNAEQLPVLWMPQSYFVQPVKSTLRGVTFNPDYTFVPEYWHFTK
jgi:peptide/nickel transport system substrate-binding protein